MKAFLRYGCRCCGVEHPNFPEKRFLNPDQITYLKGDAALEALPLNRFDLIFLWHVLEHVQAPMTLMRRLHDLLSEDGLLVMAVPNFAGREAFVFKEKWFHLDVPWHRFHFSKPSLRGLATNAGLQVIRSSEFCLEQGPYGLIQSALNAMGWRFNECYEALKGNLNPRRIPLLACQVAIGLSLAIPALLLSVLHAKEGRGAVLKMTLTKGEGPPPSTKEQMKTAEPESDAPWLKIFLLAAFFTLIAAIVILASVPPVTRDALVHHLAVPKLYLKHGAIYEIPFMVFSYYPMNLDMLYLVALRLGNDILPKFIHFGFGLLTAWLVYGYLKEQLNTIYGILGALFFLSIPLIVKLSITVYVDLGLIFFSTGALLLLLRWVNEGFKPKHLILSAVSCGLAMGTKYNGLIVCFLLTLFVAFLYARYGGKGSHGGLKALGYGGLFVAVALMVFSPWMIRNYQWKKNPIYPLYNSFFNPAPSTEADGQQARSGGSGRVGLFSYREMIYNESWPQIALLPVRVFFEGRDDNPRYFDGKLNPFLLILPLLAFFPRRSGGETLGFGNGQEGAPGIFGALFLFRLFHQGFARSIPGAHRAAFGDSLRARPQ